MHHKGQYSKRLSVPHKDLINMSNCRIYGKSPYQVALIHGGPGGAGTLKELAQMLAHDCGILEPLQTKDSIEGQLEELKKTLDQHAQLPVILIGHSWGAMLGYLFAAKYPHYTKKLIMISSGLFDASYAKELMKIRLNRMTEDKQDQLKELMNQLNENQDNADEIFHQLGQLMKAVESFDPIKIDEQDIIKGQYQIYKNVWPQVEKMRETGELLNAGKNIQCPVIAIHGDFDPHPYLGVKEPLTSVLNDFQFILLNKCGHEPWIERHARNSFVLLIKDNL